MLYGVVFSFICFIFRVFGATGSFREVEALFEFSASQLLTAFQRKEKTCLLTLHFKNAAWNCTYGHHGVAHLEGVLGTDLSDPVYLSKCKSGACALNVPRVMLVSGIYSPTKCLAKAMPLPCCQTPAFLYHPVVRKVPGGTLKVL